MKNSIHAILLSALACIATSAAAADAQPWLDASRSPDVRARLVLERMTLDEKIGLLHGIMPIDFGGSASGKPTFPAESIPGAGYIPGIPHLGIPALFETDASLGVTNPLGVRPGDVATALPAGLALGATFNGKLAFQAGAMVGKEAHAKGFNVLLGGGVNLARDPRNGRNFEYISEDPLLSGIIAGEAVRGTQSQNVISTLKHFALNALETNRQTLDARIDRAAMRESDLLAFEIAIEHGAPGSIMCAYNEVNGRHACDNQWLLDTVLKKDWGYKGWVMSDWGAVGSYEFANAGLDQESGEQLDKQVWFDWPLKRAVRDGRVSEARVNDMAHRILRSMFAVGLVEHPPQRAAIDYAADSVVALEIARQGIVLLKNESGVLPLVATVKRIAVIGGQAQLGVLSGSGSAQGTPSNGPVTRVPIGGRGDFSVFRNAVYYPSSPLREIKRIAPRAEVLYDSGAHPVDAADLARSSDVAIVFVTRHELEGYDVPDMNLPYGQNELVAAVAAANPRTIVVIESGNPIAMPWLSSVPAVLAAWYPGQEGGRAIAEILFGEVNPSGHLPMTFPRDDASTMFPTLPNRGVEPGVPVSVDYREGSDAGYRWYARSSVKPMFAFGHGLSYTTFQYENLKVRGGRTVQVEFEVANTGPVAGADVPQFYLRATPAGKAVRLLGFERVQLAPGERRRISLSADPRLLAVFDETGRRWNVAAGEYQVAVGHSADEMVLEGSAHVGAAKLRP